MELWDVYDKKGRKTGALKEKEADYLPGEYHLAVEAWVFNRRREILIQQRSWHREILPGKWSLTTGRIIAGEDSEQGCVRELKEELGIQVKQKELSFLRRIVREDPLIWDIYFTLLEVPVTEDDFYAGRLLREANIPEEVLIVMIKRHGETIIPRGSTKIKVGDILVVSSESFERFKSGQLKPPQ